MIVVLEGIRKSGKTTFATELEKWGKEMDVPVFRFYDRELQSYPVNQREANFVSCMQFIKAAEEVESKLCQLAKEPIILFDRLHISEIIFGYYYRSYNNLDLMLHVDEYLKKAKAKLILFDSATSEKRAMQNEMLFREDFREIFEHSKIDVKTTVSLDACDGKITEEKLTGILERLGF